MKVKGPHAFLTLTLTLSVPVTVGEAEMEAERFPVGGRVMIRSMTTPGVGLGAFVEACVPNERTGLEPGLCECGHGPFVHARVPASVNGEGTRYPCRQVLPTRRGGEPAPCECAQYRPVP